MDSKNNIGHSADISLTAELPIPIYNGNTIMDFKKLASLYKDELLDNVLPFWLEHSQDHEYGGYFTIKWKIAKNGWTAPFRVANS